MKVTTADNSSANGATDDGGHQQEEPQNHHDQRDAAHAVDVDGGGHIQPFAARQAHQRQHRAEQHAANGGDQVSIRLKYSPSRTKLESGPS